MHQGMHVVMDQIENITIHVKVATNAPFHGWVGYLLPEYKFVCVCVP